MALDPLADLADLSARLKTAVASGDEARANALLRDASATVRNYTGQEFTAGTTTLALLRPKNGIVRLPQRPVTAVDAVTDVNSNPITFEWWIGDDRVNTSANVPNDFAFEPWRNGINRVYVTYDHGYEEIPDDIIAVVCQIAARAFGQAPDESGITQESIAGYSYSVGGAAASGPLGMLAGERSVLDKYTHPTIGQFSVSL